VLVIEVDAEGNVQAITKAGDELGGTKDKGE